MIMKATHPIVMLRFSSRLFIPLHFIAVTPYRFLLFQRLVALVF
jgi:hypothetical protein